MTESEQIVYISCVEEVRYSFVSHLCEALRRKGIHDVFVDSDDLLSNESQSKVERARVSVMVLPGNHTVNLDKLLKVLECQKNKDQVVVPVLYGVRSLDLEWLSALYSKGFSSVHYSRKECSDSQLVKEIVRDVYEKLFYMGRIGIYSKLLEIEKMVCKQQLDIRCVGIWGMPGIGKTTLAKAVFDQMSGDYDAYCFIEDYTQAIQEKGLYRLLEEQFLEEKAVAGGTNTKLSLLRDKLNNKRVLVVLDDVRNPLAVESFRGGFDWFGPKSLIIITSRDKQVFRLCRVNQIYEVQGLNEKEALQLFSLCASIDDMAEQNLHEVSMKVIKYANGHPLALNLYGRELKGKKRPPEMETAFLELKERPPHKFVDAIKSSYETLNDSCRNIFLDIACFFKGENVDYVMQLLEGCGFFPHVGIDILVEKCLVTVSENRMCMHNLIQDVGRQIGRRSRLWEPWSIRYLLEGDEHNGTEEVEGMFLDTSNLIFDIKPAAFDNMLNLRLLKIYSSNPGVHHVFNFLKGSLYSLPNELRLLHWENYPLQFLPLNFDPMHLVEINMPYSQLKRLWGGTKNLEMLRTIRLCHSQQLVNIDDLLKAQNLEVVDLQGCTRLQSFPATGQLLHLRVINLSGCTEIKSFPEIPPNIETLHLQGTGITELQLSIVKPNYRELLNLLAEIPGLSGVSNLEQSDLKPLTSLMKTGTSNKNLSKLISLELKDCSSLRSLPDMDNLELIKVLDLSGCLELETIQGFPRNLKELYLAGTAVRQVPQLPQSLELFNAHGCVSLKSIRLDFEKLPAHYMFSNCFDLSPQVVSDFLVKALAKAQHLPRERQELNEPLAFSLCVPTHVNLNSTLDLQPGSSVMTQLNPSWRNTLVGFAMLVEVAFSEDYCDATGFGIRCVCKWKNKEGHSHRIERNLHCWAPGKAVPKVQKDHIFVFCDVNMHPSNDEGNDPDICADLVVFEFFPVDKQTKPLNGSCTVRRCGVRVITDANCNTSIENILRVLSLDPVKVSGNGCGEVLRISYDGLQEIDKALFLYIACLFNDEDAGLVAPHIGNIIDMDVSYRLKILADRSLIHVSSNGEIMMPCLLRQMGKEILYTDFKETERLGDNSMINTEKIERMRKVKKVACVEDVGSQSGEEGGVWQIKGSPCNSSKDCSARKQVERSSPDPEEAKENLIFQSDREEVDRYLKAVNEVQRHISSISISDEVKAASSTIQIAIARLEDELRNILISQTSTFEPDSLLLDSSLSSSSFASSSRTELEDDNSVFTCDGNEEEQQQQLDLVLPDGSSSDFSWSSDSGWSWLSQIRNSKSASSIQEIDLISPEAVSDLRSIAERMIGAGYSRECVQVYRNVRKSAMETIFKQLGIVKLGIGDVERLNWADVVVKTRRWIRVAKVCVRVVFASEKRLCEQIFEGTMEETCFMEIVEASALQLFSFPEAISISRRSPEKVFIILDLHDCLTDLLPDMEEIFNSKSSEAILVQATEIQSRLAEAARGILTEFENAVFRDPSVVPFPGGTILPLTRYVMNYLKKISDYKKTLIDLVMTKPCLGLKCTNDPNDPDMDISELEGISPLALHMIWTVVMLQYNLEEKSLLYKDEPLSHIFVMNNVHYIVQKVKSSTELLELIGDKYLRKLAGIFRHAATKYQRATWVRVLNSLRDEGLHVSGRFSSGVSKSALRERFNAFNTMFEEVHRIQSTWLVPDTQLREELRISISEHLIPAYRSFLGRFRGHIESGRNPENYLKYSAENLETALLDFFLGYATAPHLRRSQ